MRLVRTGYKENKYKTRMEIEDRSEEKIKKMHNNMQKLGWGLAPWDEHDGVNSLTYILYTDTVDIFKEDYKKAKAAINNKVSK